VGVPNSHRLGALIAYLGFAEIAVCLMQKNLRLDWLLFGSLTLLAISILGFAYILLQTYITVSR